ncbi:uncharacterized protein PpBr36_11165 [Pyricularia pennisetigena]|uniref:uncharacterized protein n=1 Tax=Pyricularia pennisetigena TaxID=1578925 RepID=UPI00114E1C05|nr:uncharacterized protein PpBr36_11174 [Pyricularia pennisetigena]XP_029743372.1 uncharacterized protein PpBr36_11165 [Pyricularia pennisetigena]TLS20490.1 hypothetical protein PpBr36_11174 [Pyricularia pennisetigena]TLS20522.1 hypothetical protein PpBr36_11165 [Pyricularia pennisetigena]
MGSRAVAAQPSVAFDSPCWPRPFPVEFCCKVPRRRPLHVHRGPLIPNGSRNPSTGEAVNAAASMAVVEALAMIVNGNARLATGYVMLSSKYVSDRTIMASRLSKPIR